MPSSPILAACVLLLLAAALALQLALELRRFLARTPVLTSISGVVAFRRAVTRQMYGALVVLLTGIAAVVTAAAGIALEISDVREVPVLLATGGVFGAVGGWARRVESRARAIPVVDHEIGRLRDEVVRVWTSRPLPNWEAERAM